MAGKEFLGVLNGVKKVAGAYATELTTGLSQLAENSGLNELFNSTQQEKHPPFPDFESWEPLEKDFPEGFGIGPDYPKSARDPFESPSSNARLGAAHPAPPSLPKNLKNRSSKHFHSSSLQLQRSCHSLVTPPVSLTMLQHRSFSGDTTVDSSLKRETTSKLTEKAPQRLRQKLHHRSRERAVPTTRLGRMVNFGSLAAGLGLGTAGEVAKRALGLSDESSAPLKNPMLNEANIERIVNTLCHVRGAALKLGQMISLQDGAVVPEPIQQIFERVRNNADFMPARQMERVLAQELGSNWRELVAEFDPQPLAAASIGQVHRAVMHDGREVAMKIQYPGVAMSINSDIDNLVGIMKLWNIMPEGLFLESTVAVARKELELETDYQREAQCGMRFKELLADDARFAVPSIVPELTTKRVLTAELIHGTPLDQCASLPQQTKNEIAEALLNLCLREVFEFRFMQTDPNWSNFFYNQQEEKVYLLDFGACRDYSKQFTDEYIKVIHAAVIGDRQAVINGSKKLGFLTGYESKSLLNAHVDAVMILGEPFSKDQVFDFSSQNTTARMQRLVPVLLADRLTPPPEESYSLHRKMAGSFLLCTKLNAQINCYQTFKRTYENYRFC